MTGAVTPHVARQAELPAAARARLDAAVGRDAPALTYAFVRGDGTALHFAGGRADASRDVALDPAEPMPLYSMTKAVTALATIGLLGRRGLDLDGAVHEIVPSFPFRERSVRVVDLLAHTSGLPNPLPIAWIHRPEEHAAFDERAARERASDRRVRAPGERYAYSNLGYWWLGAVVEALAGARFEDALAQLDLGGGTTTTFPPSAAGVGHVRRFGALRLAGALVAPRWVWDGASGRWARIRRHHVDGLAYGGLLGNARAVAPFVARLLAVARGERGDDLRRAVTDARTVRGGGAIAMTAALHVGALGSERMLFKEGGGMGFHSELRIYPASDAGSVVVASSSEIDVKRLLDDVDAALLRSES
jgi:CubicO group peptidase (beta-lactamase class C family)